MKKPKVSIVVTCYNHENFIEECLYSVSAQTFADWECIVVNDGSTDASSTIIQRYIENKPQFKFIDQPNSGVVSARNNAIKASQGEYIFPLDGDDKIAPSCLEKMYEAASTQKGDVIFSLVDFFGVKSGRFELELPNKHNMIFNNKVVCSALYKKADFIKYGGYDVNMNKGLEDWEFWLNFIEEGKSFYRINEVLFFYRQIYKSRNNCISKKTKEKLKRYIYKKHKKLFFTNLHLFIKEALIRFIYQKKQSPKKTIIKICKIPFYQHKNKTNKITIKNPTPENDEMLLWGDYWLGLDMQSALSDQGYTVKTDYRGNFSKKRRSKYNLVIRGTKRYTKFNYRQINILYTISHYDNISKFELMQYDIVISSSQKFCKENKKYNSNIYYLPQFTNTKRFFPSNNTDFINKILFVGNAHHGMRISVQYALKNNLPLSIYGANWTHLIDNNIIKGKYLDNTNLYKYYSNADIVLNDHMQTMKDNGSISNRIYDVTACKGFIISDYMPEIEKIYGDAIPMYKNEEEFVRLINYYLEHPNERRAKAEKAYKITIAKYTNEYFAKELKNIIDNYKRNTKTKIRFFIYRLLTIFK